MIELPNDVEYQRLSRAADAPVRRPGRRPRAVAVTGVAGDPVAPAPVRARSPEPVPALPVDTDPPPGWLPTPESRAAMDALLPPMRADLEPPEQVAARDAAQRLADAQAMARADAADDALPVRERALRMLARRLGVLGRIADGGGATVTEQIAAVREICKIADVYESAGNGGGGLTVNVGVWTHAQKIERIEKIIELGKNRSLVLAERPDDDRDGAPVGK